MSSRRMPYDISTPHGYAATLVTQICSCIVSGYYFSLFIVLFIGFCNFATAHANNIIESFQQIDGLFTCERDYLEASDLNTAMKPFLLAVKHHSYAIK